MVIFYAKLFIMAVFHLLLLPLHLIAGLFLKHVAWRPHFNTDVPNTKPTTFPDDLYDVACSQSQQWLKDLSEDGDGVKYAGLLLATQVLPSIFVNRFLIASRISNKCFLRRDIEAYGGDEDIANFSGDMIAGYLYALGTHLSKNKSFVMKVHETAKVHDALHHTIFSSPILKFKHPQGKKSSVGILWRPWLMAPEALTTMVVLLYARSFDIDRKYTKHYNFLIWLFNLLAKSGMICPDYGLFINKTYWFSMYAPHSKMLLYAAGIMMCGDNDKVRKSLYTAAFFLRNRYTFNPDIQGIWFRFFRPTDVEAAACVTKWLNNYSSLDGSGYSLLHYTKLPKFETKIKADRILTCAERMGRKYKWEEDMITPRAPTNPWMVDFLHIYYLLNGVRNAEHRQQ